MTIRRCPKCRSLPKSYIEFWSAHIIEFDAKPDGIPEDEGIMDEGDPEYVVAVCPCGHRWRLKGVLQITDLRPQPAD